MEQWVIVEGPLMVESKQRVKEVKKGGGAAKVHAGLSSIPPRMSRNHRDLRQSQIFSQPTCIIRYNLFPSCINYFFKISFLRFS